MRRFSVYGRRFALLAILSILCLLGVTSVALGDTLYCVSIAPDGGQADNGTNSVRVSADGNFAAFMSYASNLVPGDTNGWTDIFVRNLATGETELVSIASDGTQANYPSSRQSISAEGRFVAFASAASNLVPDDTNGVTDVFVRDRLLGTTERVSVATDGTQANASSFEPAISANGLFVTFESYATNLVPDDTNGRAEVFVHDRVTGITQRASVASDGVQANHLSRYQSISAEGRYVAFASYASNLVMNDTNGTWDIFVRDLLEGTTERVSIASDGTQSDNWSYPAHISADGRFVAFVSWATNLVADDTNWVWDIFVHDRVTHTTERVSIASDGAQPLSHSQDPYISGDGRYVVFTCSWPLAPEVSDRQLNIYLRDRLTSTTEAISVSDSGLSANNQCYGASVSDDGLMVAFTSAAANLVPDDTNNTWDAFVRERILPGATPVGSDVSVEPIPGVSIDFPEVTTAGESTVTISNSPPQGPPAGIRFLGTYYNIDTTAGFIGPITIAISYNPDDIPGNRENALAIFHSEGTGWTDVTTYVDTVNHVIYAEVSGFSWFAIGWPTYDWLGFLPPVAEASKPFKRGSTIPVKFRIAEAGLPAADAVATIDIHYSAEGAPVGEPEIASTLEGDVDNLFRYSPEDDLYIYNLSTKGEDFLDYYTYLAIVTLDDGTTQMVEFSLK